MIDVSDFFERPSNDKRSPRPKQTTATHMMTQEHCPTPQTSLTYLPMNTAAAAPAKPHRTEIWGILPEKRKVSCGWPACLRRQPPRVAFKNNDIYMVDNEDSNTYEEPKERHPKVHYKLKTCDNCYVRQCLLVLKIVLYFSKCLGLNMHFISAYVALSLHNCLSSGLLVFIRLGRINLDCALNNNSTDSYIIYRGIYSSYHLYI